MLKARIEEGLVAPGCAAVTPHDPQSGAPYPYSVLGDDRYRLCAEFEQGWPEAANQRDRSNRRALRRWTGPSDEARHILLPSRPGEACFEFSAVDILEEGAAEE